HSNRDQPRLLEGGRGRRRGSAVPVCRLRGHVSALVYGSLPPSSGKVRKGGASMPRFVHTPLPVLPPQGGKEPLKWLRGRTVVRAILRTACAEPNCITAFPSHRPGANGAAPSTPHARWRSSERACLWIPSAPSRGRPGRGANMRRLVHTPLPVLPLQGG